MLRIPQSTFIIGLLIGSPSLLFKVPNPSPPKVFHNLSHNLLSSLDRDSTSKTSLFRGQGLDDLSPLIARSVRLHPHLR